MIETSFRLLLALLILIFVTTLILPIIAIASVLRGLIFLWAVFWDPDIDSPLVGLDAVFALTDKSIRIGYIITILVLENGKKDTVHQLRESFAQTLMCQPELYKRLWHYFVPFGGFAFWKRDRRFHINNQIRDYDYGGVLKLPDHFYFEDLPKLAAKLQRVELPRGRSPWEFLVIRDVLSREDPTSAAKTILLLRFDHVVADGLSTISAGGCLFSAECSHASPSVGSAREQNFILSTLALIFSPLTWAYDYACFIRQCRGRRPAFSRSTLATEVTCGMSNPIAFEDIKKIKNTQGVSITNILHAVNFEATLRTLKEIGHPVPDTLTTSLLSPLPNRPKNELGNFMTGAYFILATEVATAVQRLHSIDRQLTEQSMARPSMPLLTTTFIRAISNLPVACVQAIVSSLMNTNDIPLSTIPLLTLPARIVGLTCIDVLVFPSVNPYGIQGFAAGGNGKLRYTYAVKNVFPDPKFTERVCDNVENVIHELLQPVN